MPSIASHLGRNINCTSTKNIRLNKKIFQNPADKNISPNYCNEYTSFVETKLIAGLAQPKLLLFSENEIKVFCFLFFLPFQVSRATNLTTLKSAPAWTRG